MEDFVSQKKNIVSLSGKCCVLAILFSVCFSVLAGSHASYLLKLAHKMQLIFIAAKESQRGDGHLGGAQIKFSEFNARGNNILNTCHTEEAFV